MRYVNKSITLERGGVVIYPAPIIYGFYFSRIAQLMKVGVYLCLIGKRGNTVIIVKVASMFKCVYSGW